MKTLTLVVTYNEAENITQLVSEILKYLPDTSVLIVDDNSSDGTADAVRATRARRAAPVEMVLRLLVLKHVRNGATRS